MKNIKKIVICLVVCFVIAGLLAVAAVGFQSEKYDKTIVYLGDSICEGILGSSPFSERDSYGYYAIIGRCNNYRYVDKSVSGDTAKLMYQRLTRDNTPDMERQYWVSQADIIHISILGNDLLSGDLGQTAIEVLSGDYSGVNNKLSGASEYFALSIERIKELNPDVTLLVSTLYNPLDSQTTLLTNAQKTALMEVANGDESQFRVVGGLLLDELNNVIYDYLEENPGAYEIIDVYTAFDNTYNESYEDGTALIYGDWLHPSNEGHAVMANLIQAKLEELEFADREDAVAKYKTLRKTQLERLFADTTVDVASVKEQISAANTFEEVSEAYFKSVRGVIPKYINKPITRHRGKIFKETKTFDLSSIVMGADELTSFFNKDKSYVTYREDGTFSIKLQPSSLVISAANMAIYFEGENGGLDVSGFLGAPSFGTGMETYLQEVFPGFDFHDIRKSIELLSSVGVYINGLDFESEGMIALMNSMQQDLIIPPQFILPSDISIEVRGNYFVEQAGDFTNIHMCVGNVSNNGYPFLYATLHTEDNGDTWIETSIEVSKITLYAGDKPA